MWIADTQNPASYNSFFPDQINYKDDVDDDISSAMQKIQREKILSEPNRPLSSTQIISRKNLYWIYISIQSKEKEFHLRLLVNLKISE